MKSTSPRCLYRQTIETIFKCTLIIKTGSKNRSYYCLAAKTSMAIPPDGNLLQGVLVLLNVLCVPISLVRYKEYKSISKNNVFLWSVTGSKRCIYYFHLYRKPPANMFAGGTETSITPPTLLLRIFIIYPCLIVLKWVDIHNQLSDRYTI